MVLPCILSLAFLGVLKSTVFFFGLTLPHSHRIDHPRFPNPYYGEQLAASWLVSLSSYGLLLHIIGRERIGHCSHHIQNHQGIRRTSGIQDRYRSGQLDSEDQRKWTSWSLSSRIDIDRIRLDNICRATHTVHNVQVCHCCIPASWRFCCDALCKSFTTVNLVF